MSVDSTGMVIDTLSVKLPLNHDKESQLAKNVQRSDEKLEQPTDIAAFDEEQSATVATGKEGKEVKEVKEVKEDISAPQLEKVAKQLQEFIGKMNRGLEFLVDEDSGRDVIKVIDKTSGELIKQYPSEEVLSLVSKLSEATGNFVDSKI